MRMWLMLVYLTVSFATVSAAPITQERASEIAAEFLSNEQSNPPQIVSVVKDGRSQQSPIENRALGDIKTLANSDGDILAFVQKLEPRGFIIISADDALRPILGFSFGGDFPFTPAGNSLLNMVAIDTRERKKAAKFGQYEDGDLGTVLGPTAQWGPYIQTTWSQGGIYRDKCPYRDPGDPGTRRPTGCTAISMAQIMYFHQFPRSVSFAYDGDHYVSRAAVENAQGEITGYDVIDIDGSSAQYDFPTFGQLNGSLNQILYNGDADEISNLCFGTGVKLHMTYGRTGSGAWRPEAYLTGFDYGSAIPSDDWNDVRDNVILNMKDGLPVQIAIYNSDPSVRGGHSVIVDGYRDDDYFHVNYGWGANSPDPIADAWYNIPSMPRYDVVAMVIYDISASQGWSQFGANAQNTFGSPYGSPRDNDISLKWRVACPSSLSFSNILIGTSNNVYAAVSTDGSSGHPFVYVIDQFGTTIDQIELNRDGNIEFMCQGSDGEVFAAMEDGYIFRIDPEQGSAVQIFEEPNGDDIYALKIDEEGWLIATTFYRVYALTRTGALRWASPFEAPSGNMFLGGGYIPTIDVARQKIYVTYYNSTSKHAYLAALNRSTGQAAQTRDLGSVTIPSFRAISLGTDGTLYLRLPGVLYALNPDNLLGSPRWTRSLSITTTPAVGRDGTLYCPYWEEVSGTWYNRLGAFDPSDGSTLWTVSFQLDPSEEDVFQPYIASNGVVLFTIEHDGSPKTYTLHAYKDNQTSAQELWSFDAGVSGGDYAFGPGNTVYAWGKTGIADTIYALSDGDIGDPYGAGENFVNNSPPSSASSPSPADESVEQSAGSVQLSWTCSDPNVHSLKYDVYACALMEGEEAALVPVASQISGNSCTLTGLEEGLQYVWTVVATDGQAVSSGPVWSFSTEGIFVGVDDEETGGLPTIFQLDQNYPNPFNPSTVIEFELPKRSHVSIAVYNLLGQRVTELANEEFPAGSHQVTWDGMSSDGQRVSTGIYFYRIKAGDFIDSKKMLLLK